MTDVTKVFSSTRVREEKKKIIYYMLYIQFNWKYLYFKTSIEVDREKVGHIGHTPDSGKFGISAEGMILRRDPLFEKI